MSRDLFYKREGGSTQERSEQDGETKQTAADFNGSLLHCKYT